MAGDCFTIAVGFLEEAPTLSAALREPFVKGDKSRWRIVHGLPVFRGPGADGSRYWHAWVEHREPDGGTDVLDFSNGKQVRMNRILYYALGRLEEEHVWRFTPVQAREALAGFGHCGPWVEGWEQMGDGDGDPERPSRKTLEPPCGT